MSISIVTERFFLRELSIDDVTQQYLLWFEESSTKEHIEYAEATVSMAELKEYVALRVDKEDVLFLGIFDKETSMHIGNIKYEPINIIKSYAVMGILIGDASYRGKGVAQEVIAETARWLKSNRKINDVYLGVSKNNAPAISAYKNLGFLMCEDGEVQSTCESSMIMRLSL